MATTGCSYCYIVFQNHVSSQVFWSTATNLGCLTLLLSLSPDPSYLTSTPVRSAFMSMRLLPTFVLFFMFFPLPRRRPSPTPVLSFTVLAPCWPKPKCSFCKKASFEAYNKAVFLWNHTALLVSMVLSINYAFWFVVFVLSPQINDKFLES